ncbi:MAG TPA: hypothetical protein VF587_01395, partial [Solirubrobacteraceae bacterium]
RRAVALAAAALLLAAVPAEAKPLRFAAKCTVKKKCRTTKGWRARALVKTPSAGAPAPQPAPFAPPAEETAAPPPAPGQGGSGAAPPPPPPPACDPSPWLGVIAEDADGFRLRLTRTCVPAGTVLFNFRNEDLAHHNLWAEGVDPVAAPRQVVEETDGETTVNRSADLTPGEWRLYCSFEGHEAMTRLVDVTPAG